MELQALIVKKVQCPVSAVFVFSSLIDKAKWRFLQPRPCQLLGPWIEHHPFPLALELPDKVSHQLLKHTFPALSMFPSLEAVCKHAALCGGMDHHDYKWGFVSLYLSRAVTQRGAVCSVSPCPNTAQHHEMALQLQQRFSLTHDVWVRGCQRRQALASCVWCLWGNDDAIHPGLEINAFLFSLRFLPLLPGSFTGLTLRIPMLYKARLEMGILYPAVLGTTIFLQACLNRKRSCA